MPKEMEFQGVLVTVQTSGRLIGALIPFNRSGKPHNTRVVFCFFWKQDRTIVHDAAMVSNKFKWKKEVMGEGGGAALFL